MGVSAPNQTGSQRIQYAIWFQPWESNSINWCLKDIAVAQNVEIYKSNPPKPQDLRLLCACLKDPALNDYILGEDHEIWHNEEYKADLSVLYTAPEEDILLKGLSTILLDIYHGIYGHRFKKPVDEEACLYEYSKSRLFKISSILTTAISSLLPILAVVVLWVITNMAARLGIVASFTVAFSITLRLVTEAKKTEIFMATSTWVLLYVNVVFGWYLDRFAAVLVVFIGSVGPTAPSA
jgi:hypothetical protein